MQRMHPDHGSGAAQASPVLRLFERLAAWPGGTILFSRLVCLKAPYFASIRPRVTLLAPGVCEARIRQRRRVQNHIGTVHAIALCNLAELVGGLATDASLPGGMRWIPKGMDVAYLGKARGEMRATATPAFAPQRASEGYELPVDVEVRDPVGAVVFTARIRMWVSPLPPR